MKISGVILQVVSLGVVGVLAFAGGFLQSEAIQTAAYRQEKEAELQLRAQPPVEVATLELKTTTWQETFTYTGTVHPWRQARLAFAEGGTVRTLAVDKGHLVKGPAEARPGQVLATVDRVRLEATLAAARASLAKAEWDLRKEKKLFAKGQTSEERVKQLETLGDLRRAELTQVRKSLADTTLRAPFDGVIADRMIELGENAMPGSPAYRLIQLDRVKVIVSLPGRRINQLRPNQAVEVAVQTGPDRTVRLQGRVHHIPPAAKELRFAVEIAVDNREGVLKEGMIATARFFGRKHQGMFVLPLETVIQVGATRKVMLMDAEGDVTDGWFDLGYLPAEERDRVVRALNAEDGSWRPVSVERWNGQEIKAVHRLAARVADPKVHKLRGAGVQVFHRGKRARAVILEGARIEGNHVVVPPDGPLKAGDTLIARGQYRVVDGGEVRISEANELGLPGEAKPR